MSVPLSSRREIAAGLTALLAIAITIQARAERWRSTASNGGARSN